VICTRVTSTGWPAAKTCSGVAVELGTYEGDEDIEFDAMRPQAALRLARECWWLSLLTDSRPDSWCWHRVNQI
jgi:hypothetical protein